MGRDHARRLPRLAALRGVRRRSRPRSARRPRRRPDSPARTPSAPTCGRSSRRTATRWGPFCRWGRGSPLRRGQAPGLRCPSPVRSRRDRRIMAATFSHDAASQRRPSRSSIGAPRGCGASRACFSRTGRPCHCSTRTCGRRRLQVHIAPAQHCAPSWCCRRTGRCRGRSASRATRSRRSSTTSWDSRAGCTRSRYPCPGDRAVAQMVAVMLERAGMEARLDPDRGLDHGAWVPLSLAFPEADGPGRPGLAAAALRRRR
ncbi:MAG: hypothetical protein MZV64_43395 [Ignavibacteriales bacterium]|nr:hypothetical protein [Ignavibacteriales bacterium]